ncbi:hypothetical protein Tco_0381658 [Tanacetum coccineum]
MCWQSFPCSNSGTPESGSSTELKMTVPSTGEEKICKKNDVKAQSLLLMALPNEHQLTFNQYVDAQSMFVAIKARFGGNDATKKTQKALLKQQYENFNASSLESLDSIFNRLQKLVSILAILGVVTPPEDLNVKFLRSLPSEWDTHVLCHIHAFLSTQPQGRNFHEDLEQLHDDDLEEMDLKWNVALLSMRAGKAPRSKDNINWNQGSLSKAVKIEDASEKAMCAIDDDTGFIAATYKRGLSILEAHVVKYKEFEVLFSEDIALLKRSIGHKEYLMGLLKTELEKVKEEKEGFEFKLAKFEKSSKDLDDLLASQITTRIKTGHEEFKQPEVNAYGPRDSSLKPSTICDKESDNSKENTDDSLKQQHKTVTKTSSVKSPLKVDKAWKEKFFYPANHVRVEEPKKARENTDAPIIED